MKDRPTFTRRAWLAASCAGTLPALAAADPPSRPEARGAVGLVIHSFPIRSRTEPARGGASGFADPARFLEYGKSLGVGYVQVGLGIREPAETKALRERAEAAGMAFEGIVSLPRDQSDVERFEAEIRTAKAVGAEVVRTVALSSRRYETFDSLAAFRRFTEQATHRLTLAAPIAARHGVGLAVENHKDWRADEQLAVLKNVGGDRLGVCLDTGNSIALLEDPMEVIETLAPLTLTTHFKDMAVQEYGEGFLLSEVPLGSGLLDLPRIVGMIRTKAARPNVRFNLEMITRDPLKIPCLTPRYWTTFPNLPAQVLARALTSVRSHVPERPLPLVSTLARDEQLRVEDENIRRCLDFMRGPLGLATGKTS